MKNLSIVLAVVGGAIAGATVGFLFAPQTGEETRNKIAECVRTKMACLKKGKIEDLID